MAPTRRDPHPRSVLTHSIIDRIPGYRPSGALQMGLRALVAITAVGLAVTCCRKTAEPSVRLSYRIPFALEMAQVRDAIVEDLEHHLKTELSIEAIVTTNAVDRALVALQSAAEVARVRGALKRSCAGRLVIAAADGNKLTLALDPRYRASQRTLIAAGVTEMLRWRARAITAKSAVARRGDLVQVALPRTLAAGASFDRAKEALGRRPTLSLRIIDDEANPIARIAAKDEQRLRRAGVLVERREYDGRRRGMVRAVTLAAADRATLRAVLAALPSALSPPKAHEYRVGSDLLRGDGRYRAHLVAGRDELSGDYLSEIKREVSADGGRPVVRVDWDRRGAMIFERVSGENVGARVALVLDGEIIATPVIARRIDDGVWRLPVGGGSSKARAERARKLVAILTASKLLRKLELASPSASSWGSHGPPPRP